MKKKIICFGLGRIYQTFLALYDSSKAEIVALSDNDSVKWTSAGVIAPFKIKELEFDFIIITSAYYIEIKKQLCDMGIDETYIWNFYDIYRHLSIVDECSILDILKNTTPITAKWDVRELKNIQQKELVLTAKIFANSVADKKISSIEEAEFQVYSQFGEDGIIQWLIHNVDIKNKTFIEFGVEDYTESNTRFLLMNNNWTGLVMDGSENSINCLKRWESFWRYDLTAVAAFITKDNINALIRGGGFRGDMGILSIDLDGNDWWILNAIDCVSPRILICEYNKIGRAHV